MRPDQGHPREINTSQPSLRLSLCSHTIDCRQCEKSTFQTMWRFAIYLYVSVGSLCTKPQACDADG